MTKPDGVAPETNDDVSSAWGTWEELLLAFAVNRHGTGAWDSIASELQKRISDPNLCLTALNCRSKYLDLKRRFVLNNGDLEDGHDEKSNVEESVPLLEELRKLRVAELRREVQRYDLNIESLQLKMKTMEEERERGVTREKSEADLENNKAEEKRDRLLEGVTADGTETAAATELEKDQLSVNESNSTDPGAEKVRSGDGGSEPAGAAGAEMRNAATGQTSEEPAELKSEPDQKSVREDSCNGSSNSIEEPNRKAKKAEPAAELTESEAESDGGGADATKENSDVQSSAGRSRKEEASDQARRGSTSGDEREHEDESGAVKELAAESQPLVEFLQAIRATKLGSVFERRLRSQETSKYHKMILQHMDLQTVETRLKQGWYSASAAAFFRDLLLLVNNALVFFPNNSPEAMAAADIRRLISKETSHRSFSSSHKHISLPPEASPSSSSPSLMLKPGISGSLIICRKRSSIAAKKKEQTPLLPQEKDTKQQQQQQPSGEGEADEPKITKKRTRDRFPAASTNTKKNGKNQGSNNNNNGKQSSSPAESGKQQQGKGQQAEAKGDSKKSQSTSDSKKRGAANFLNRMKQGSSSNNNSVLLDALKNTPLTTSESATGKGGSDQKKSAAKKEVAAAATRKQTKEKEKSSPGKRNVGRPPKRGAGPSPALGKRGRDRGEPPEAAAAKQPKKRSRKL